MKRAFDLEDARADLALTGGVMHFTIGRLRLGVTRPGYFRMGQMGWHFAVFPAVSVAWDKAYWQTLAPVTKQSRERQIKNVS